MPSSAELTGQQPSGLPAGTGIEMLRGPAVVKALDGLGRPAELLLDVCELGPEPCRQRVQPAPFGAVHAVA
jgi:hypothetical protein